MMFPGATCLSQENLWRESPDPVPAAVVVAKPPAKRPAPGPGTGRGGRKAAVRRGGGRRGLSRRFMNADPIVIPDKVATRVAMPRGCKQFVEPKMHSSGHSTMPEYIPGRDTFVEEDSVAMGYTLRQQGQVVLSTGAVTADTVQDLAPFVLAAMQLHAQGELEPGNEGRYSAGPLDLAAYLSSLPIADAVDRTVERRQQRNIETGLPAGSRSRHLPFVVHVHPDGRRAYIGEETDKTRNGETIMTHNKSFKSLPIRSWTGGAKVSDMPGGQKRLTQGKLCLLPIQPGLKERFIRGAEAVWRTLAASDTCSHIAKRMLELMRENPIQACSRLGETGFNAYSINLDYRTGTHTDGKNWPGTMSALVILETGPPFCGGFYMLPQFHVAIAVRQGTVLFHRSGDPDVGLHGNSEIYHPDPSSHRIAVVLYQTKLHTAKQIESETARTLRIPPSVLSIPPPAPPKAPTEKADNTPAPTSEPMAATAASPATDPPALRPVVTQPAAADYPQGGGNISGSPATLPAAGPAAAAAAAAASASRANLLSGAAGNSQPTASAGPRVQAAHPTALANGRSSAPPTPSAAAALAACSRAGESPALQRMLGWPPGRAQAAMAGHMNASMTPSNSRGAAISDAQPQITAVSEPPASQAIYPSGERAAARVMSSVAGSMKNGAIRPAGGTGGSSAPTVLSAGVAAAPLAAAAVRPGIMVAGGAHVQLDSGGGLAGWPAHIRAVPVAASMKGMQQTPRAGVAGRGVAGGEWSQDGSAGSGLSSTWGVHVAARSSHSGAQQSGSDSTHSHRPGSGDTGAAIPSAAELESSIVGILRMGGIPGRALAPAASGVAADGPMVSTGGAPTGAIAANSQWPHAAVSGALMQQQAAQQASAQAAVMTAPRWGGFMTGAPSSAGCWSWQARQAHAALPSSAPLTAGPSGGGSAAAPHTAVQWRWGRERASGPVAEGLEDMQATPAAHGAVPAWETWRMAQQQQQQQQQQQVAVPADPYAQMHGSGLSQGSAQAWAADGPGARSGNSSGTIGGAAAGVHTTRTGPWGSLPAQEYAPVSVTTGNAHSPGLSNEARRAAMRGLSTANTFADPLAMHAHNMHSAQQISEAFGRRMQAFSASASPHANSAYSGAMMQMTGSPDGMQFGDMLDRRGGAGAQHAGQGTPGVQARWSVDGSGPLASHAQLATAHSQGLSLHRGSWPGNTQASLLALSQQQHAAERVQRGWPEGYSTAQPSAVQRGDMLIPRTTSLGSQWEALMGDVMPRSTQHSRGGNMSPMAGQHGGEPAGMALTQGGAAGLYGSTRAGVAAVVHSQAFTGAGDGAGGMRAAWGSQAAPQPGTQMGGAGARVEGGGMAFGGRWSNDGGQGGHRRSSMSSADIPQSPPAAAGVVWPYKPAYPQRSPTQRSPSLSREASGSQRAHTPVREPGGSQGLFGGTADDILSDPRHQSPTTIPPERGPWGTRSPMKRDGSCGPSHSGQAPAHSGHTPSHSGQAPAHSGHTPSHSGHTPSHSGDHGASQPVAPTRIGSVMSGRALPMPPGAMQGMDPAKPADAAGPADGGSAAMKREHTARSLGEWQPLGKQAKQFGAAQHAASHQSAAVRAAHAAAHSPDDPATADLARSVHRQSVVAALQAAPQSMQDSNSFASAGLAQSHNGFQRGPPSRSPSADGMRNPSGHQQSSSPCHPGMNTGIMQGRWSPQSSASAPQWQQQQASPQTAVQYAEQRSGPMTPPHSPAAADMRIGSPQGSSGRLAAEVAWAGGVQQRAAQHHARPVMPVPMFRESFGDRVDVAHLQRSGRGTTSSPSGEGGHRLNADSLQHPNPTGRQSPARTPESPIMVDQSPGYAMPGYRPRMVLMSQLPLVGAPSPGGSGGTSGGTPLKSASPAGAHAFDTSGQKHWSSPSRAAGASLSPDSRPALVMGAGPVHLKEEPHADVAAAAGPAGGAAALSQAEVKPEGAEEAWPWTPGTILNINQTKWKALLAEDEAAEGEG